MPLTLIGSQLIEVREADFDVDTHLNVQPGGTSIFHASGEIWAGVWFTGNNGRRGWNNIAPDPKFPLPSSHPYGLLGKLDAGYFYVGDNSRIDDVANKGELFLRINDDVPGNGAGSFTCIVQLYRNE